LHFVNCQVSSFKMLKIAGHISSEMIYKIPGHYLPLFVADPFIILLCILLTLRGVHRRCKHFYHVHQISSCLHDSCPQLLVALQPSQSLRPLLHLKHR